MATAVKLSAKEAAAQIGTDARTLRKFIRSEKANLPIDPCGQGNRYEFTSAEVKALKKQFIAWSGGTTKTEAPAPPAAKKGKKSKAKAEVPDMTHEDPDEVEEIDLTDDDLDPTDEQMEQLEVENLDD